jgi:hypothetical protein
VQESRERQRLLQFRGQRLVAIVASLLVFLAVVVFAYKRMVTGSVCCDAVSYGQLAASYQTEGFFTQQEVARVRTYVYPAFLSLIQSPEAFLLPAVGAYDPIVALWHALIYVAATLCLVIAARRLGAFAQSCIAVGLLCNVFLLVYIPYRLTEILSLSMAIVAVAITLEISRSRAFDGSKSAILVVLGSFVVGLAVLLRPSNMALVAGWAAFVLVYFAGLWRSSPQLGTVLRILGLAICAAIAFTEPFIPQWFINKGAFGRGTLITSADLGTQQLIWGIQYLKYGTVILDGPRGLIYGNPFAVMKDQYLTQPLLFYIENPLRGAVTIGLHVFNSLTFDYLYPYVPNLRPWYMPFTLALNHIVVWAGALTGVALLYHYVGRALFEAKHGWVFFVCGSIAAICMINAGSAVESRFGLPILAALGPLALYGLIRLKKLSRGWQIGLVLSTAVYVGGAVWLSLWVLSLAAPRG